MGKDFVWHDGWHEHEQNSKAESPAHLGNPGVCIDAVARSLKTLLWQTRGFPSRPRGWFGFVGASALVETSLLFLEFHPSS
jgi:hypothetical protein